MSERERERVRGRVVHHSRAICRNELGKWKRKIDFYCLGVGREFVIFFMCYMMIYNAHIFAAHIYRRCWAIGSGSNTRRALGILYFFANGWGDAGRTRHSFLLVQVLYMNSRPSNVVVKQLWFYDCATQDEQATQAAISINVQQHQQMHFGSVKNRAQQHIHAHMHENMLT